MTVIELKEKLDKKEDILILDVREKDEFEYANIGGTHIPLSEFAQRFQELDSDKHWAVLCHHGMRSAQAVAFLRSQGFKNVQNISGGIEAWSVQIDPKLPRY
ncbi:MAG: rhodanese [Deltaproteobacteria bacterium]|nr:rhodanese [Deltaproteobacteria bacterium]MBM4316129.1 rhodanese [Deltaproteobacteria bacterium]